MYLKYNLQKKAGLKEKIEFKEGEGQKYNFSFRDQEIVLGGKFYYFNTAAKQNVVFGQGIKLKLAKLLKKLSIGEFINSVEGEYWGVKMDYKNNSLMIFSDKLKQLELYYFYNEDVFLLADDPKIIVDEIGIKEYESNSLISAVALYVLKGHSLFKGLKRLKYNEIVKLEGSEVNIEKISDKDIKIKNYSEKELFSYKNLVKSAVLSRASNKMNLVFSSGGWDSTLIMAILAKYFGKDRVRGITMKITLADGRCFNTYEIEKIRKISKMLGVKSDIVEMDYQKEKLYPGIYDVKDNLFYRGLLFLAPANWSKTINYIKDKYGEDAVIFHGEGCDSLQNFGFSQFETLFHDNEDFRAYADKMNNYLYGPSFFKKIEDNSFEKDNVYKIFRKIYQDKEFVEVKSLDFKRKIYHFLMSFVMSDIRIPFRKVECQKYVREGAFKRFESWLEENYLKETIENINPDNLYYHYFELYTSFHLQSPQIYTYRTGLKNVRFPYIDLNLFNFLARLPEQYGRGLEFRPTKFLEKEYAKEVLPKELVAMLEAGPHSYLYETEDMNPYDEYWLKGSVFQHMKDKISPEKIKRIFDNDVFNVKEIEEFAVKYKQGKLKNLSSVETKLLLLLVLLSIHPNA